MKNHPRRDRIQDNNAGVPVGKVNSANTDAEFAAPRPATRSRLDPGHFVAGKIIFSALSSKIPVGTGFSVPAGIFCEKRIDF